MTSIIVSISNARFGEKPTWKSSRALCLSSPRIPAVKGWGPFTASVWWGTRSRSSARVVAAIENLVKDPVEAPAIIELPAELERWQGEDSSRVGDVQARLREEFTKWFAKGYAAVALRTAPGNRAYLLAPWSNF